MINQQSFKTYEDPLEDNEGIPQDTPCTHFNSVEPNFVNVPSHFFSEIILPVYVKVMNC